MWSDQMVDLLASTLRMSAPLLFAALGGMLSERSGVINIALEGLMLMGAFFAAACTHYFGSPWMGALGGVTASVFLAGLYATTVILFRANQIVAGTGINLLAMGLCPFFSNLFFGTPGSTPTIEIDQRFHNELFWLVWILSGFMYFWFRTSSAALRLSFAGEKPEALTANGISVVAIRWKAVLMSGVFCGLSGATLSIALSSSFSRNMTAGRGFMALAALILGRWKPVPTALACLFFGFSDGLQIRLQGIEFPILGAVPVQFIQIIPYVITLVILAGFFGGSKAPRALGRSLSLAAIFLFVQSCMEQNSKEPAKQAKLKQKAEAQYELLTEMYENVFQKPLIKIEFLNEFGNALQQGGSLIGVYQGLTRSDFYREHEEKTQGQGASTLERFCSILNSVRTGANQPTAVRVKDAMPLVVMGVSEMQSASNRSSEKMGSCIEIFKNSSPYTQRRFLGDEFLTRIEALKSNPDKLADFYAQWVLDFARFGVDFGIPERSKPDLEFHRQWAKKATLEQLEWEILNRVYRSLKSSGVH